jgi:hypothetical protein
VVAEVAFSLLLLTGAGLMIESVTRILKANPGYDSENLLFVHPGLLRGEKYYYSERAGEIHSALYAELQERFAGPLQRPDRAHLLAPIPGGCRLGRLRAVLHDPYGTGPKNAPPGSARDDESGGVVHDDALV